MYPFEDGLEFVHNAWYAAGFSAEFNGELVSRRFLDEPIVMYRTTTGAVVALADRCAHRGFPLSRGARQGEGIRCGYHGFEYAPDGRCSGIPSQEKVPPAIRVRSYPILERAGVVWIWMGEAALADELMLPDLAELGFAHQRYLMAVGGTKRFDCRYQLVHENLLDLSHVNFLHQGTIGTPHIVNTPLTTTTSGNVVEAVRTVLNDEATPFHERALGAKIGHMDRTTRSVFFAPSSHVTHIRMVAPGTDAQFGEPGYYGEMRNAHLVTPIDRYTTLYFWTTSRTANLDDATTAFMIDSIRQIFEQDAEALEYQEERIREEGRFQEFSCRADAAALKARRLMTDLMRREQIPAATVRPLTTGGK